MKNTSTSNGLVDVSALGLRCRDCGGSVTELPFYPRTKRPVACMDCTRLGTPSNRRRSSRVRPLIVNDAVWSDEQITVDGKKISTRAFFLRDGTPVVSGSLKYSPATGLAPELWVSRSQVRGRRLAYAIPVNPRRDCPEQWNTRHPISYPLIFEKRELSDGSSVAVSFVNDLIEVRLDATRAETTKLGAPYWTRVFVNRRYLNGIPHKVIQVEMIPGVDLIRASEMRLEEERMLGPTGVWHHAKIFGLSGKNPEQDGEKALYISPAEVKDCFELISLISGMEVTVDSSLEELKKAYRKGAQKLNEGKIAAAFSQGVPFVTKKRNEIRRRELNKAYEKAIDVREGLLMHQIGEYVENAIRGGRVSESDLHAQVKVLLKDIRNLSELVFDPSIQLDGVDRAEALTIVAEHLIKNAALDVFNVIDDVAVIDESSDEVVESA